MNAASVTLTRHWPLPVRAVLWRVERELLTREQAYEVLAALGLVEFTFGRRPYRDPIGKLSPHRLKNRKKAP